MEGNRNIIEERKRARKLVINVYGTFILISLSVFLMVIAGRNMADNIYDFEARVFAARDHNGRVEYDIVRDRGDDIYIDLLQKEDGEYVSFTSDAYHLEAWCEEHGFDYFEDEISVPVHVTFEK